MNAVILAGSVRSDLEVSGLPRPLWPFPSEPLISQVISFLTRNNCRRVAICANGKTQLIASELSGSIKPWRGLRYCEDPLPRGPAGCLRDLQDWLAEGAAREPFVAIQGTAFYDFDFSAMIADHRRSGAAITVGARAADARDSAAADHLEPAGVYVIDPRTLPLIPAVGFHDIKEQLLPKVVDAGMLVSCHQIRGSARLIHGRAHYLAAMEEAILRAAKALPPEFAQSPAGSLLHERAKVHAGARLTGPVWIDNGAVVDDGACLIGPVVVGPSGRIGPGALVQNSVIMRGARIGSGLELFGAVVPPNETRTSDHNVYGTIVSGGARGAPERGWAHSGLRQGVQRLGAIFGMSRRGSTPD